MLGAEVAPQRLPGAESVSHEVGVALQLAVGVPGWAWLTPFPLSGEGRRHPALALAPVGGQVREAVEPQLVEVGEGAAPL